MSTALIARDDAALTISFTENAVALKETALNEAALVGRVSNGEENGVANATLAKLSELRRTVEKARKEAKQPVLDFGRKIDDAAEKFVAEVKTEEWRVSQLIGEFFAVQEAKRKAAEQATRMEAERIATQQRLEQERILREQVTRENAERQAREAADRKVQEALRAASEAKNAAERKAAAIAREEAERQQIEIKRLQEQAAANTRADLDAANERAVAAREAVVVAPREAVRAQGQTVKQDWEITVVDIHKLYKFHPNCVSMEPRLTEIKSLIQAGATVQGVTAKQVMKAGVRSGRQQAAIDI